MLLLNGCVWGTLFSLQPTSKDMQDVNWNKVEIEWEGVKSAFVVTYNSAGQRWALLVLERGFYSLRDLYDEVKKNDFVIGLQAVSKDDYQVYKWRDIASFPATYSPTLLIPKSNIISIQEASVEEVKSWFY